MHVSACYGNIVLNPKWGEHLTQQKHGWFLDPLDSHWDSCALVCLLLFFCQPGCLAKWSSQLLKGPRWQTGTPFWAPLSGCLCACAQHWWHQRRLSALEAFVHQPTKNARKCSSTNSWVCWVGFVELTPSLATIRACNRQQLRHRGAADATASPPSSSQQWLELLRVPSGYLACCAVSMQFRPAKLETSQTLYKMHETKHSQFMLTL